VLVVVVVDGLVDIVVSSVVVVLVCANASGAASPQTKAMIVFFTLSSLISLPPKFVTQGLSGRFRSVLYFDGAGNALFELVCHFGDLSERLEFAETECP